MNSAPDVTSYSRQCQFVSKPAMTTDTQRFCGARFFLVNLREDGEGDDPRTVRKKEASQQVRGPVRQMKRQSGWKASQALEPQNQQKRKDGPGQAEQAEELTKQRAGWESGKKRGTNPRIVAW